MTHSLLNGLHARKRATPASLQWRRLEDDFQRLRAGEAAQLLPAFGALAAFAVFGHTWYLAWAAAIGVARLAAVRIATRFDLRRSDSTAAQWLRTHAAVMYGQAAIIGAGGLGAAASGQPIACALVGLPLSFAATRIAASDALPGVAHAQAALLLGPLVVGAAAALQPGFFALALVAGVQMALLMMRLPAEEAMPAMLAPRLPLDPNGHGAMAPSAADFQKLLGRCQATGMPNRHSFAHLLSQEAARAHRAETQLSLLLVQWDGFETHTLTGRDMVAEAEIAHIGRRLRAELKRPADIIASLGAGRFAILLPFTDAFGATTVARNLQNALRPPVSETEVEQGAPDIELSVGCATYCGKGFLPESQLLSYAEDALESARKTGGNRISRYDPTTPPRRPPYAEARLELELLGVAQQEDG